MYDQECALYGFHKHNLKNEQYYEQFYTKVDVVEDIGITRQHRVLMEEMAQEFIFNFDDLSSDEKQEVINDTKERYLSYIFLPKSGNQYKN